jgi:hypothetical protein
MPYHAMAQGRKFGSVCHRDATGLLILQRNSHIQQQNLVNGLHYSMI